MKVFLCPLLLTLAIAKSRGDVTGTNPGNGDCLCYDANAVNVRSSACGTVIGSANAGECFKYKGEKKKCRLDKEYEFFLINWKGRNGWSAGKYLIKASNSRCESSGSGGGGTTAANEYKCSVTDKGKRIHEGASKTPYDCEDTRCRNTCKGGQCVAYVTCRCKRNGKWAPNTSCWKSGRKVQKSDGKCNRAIAPNTAIATFDSNGNYYAGHAAVFIRCKDDYTVEVYDQGCSSSIGYSTYSSTHSYFRTFATITNGGCADRSSWPCRAENAGPTSCPVSVPGC